MLECYFLFAIVLLSALISFVSNDKIAKFSTIASSLISIILSILIWNIKPLISGWLYIDALSKIMIATITIIYFTTSLFSISYFEHVKKPLLKKNLYWAFMNLFVLSMLFSVAVGNLGFVWVGIEATTITSALLVAIDNNYPSIEASWRYIIIVSVGLIASLVGIIFIYAQTKTLNIPYMINHHINPSSIMLIGSAMTIIGFGTKAGIFPMHTWLPDVHGRSIAPVSAIFSSVLLPSAIFGIIRVLQISNSYEINRFVFSLGVLTVMFAALFIVNQQYYKRMFAYSSIENMGVILIGISLGKYGILGAIILLISHAFAKSSAFYLTGNILSVYKSRKIREINSLTTRMPYTGYGLMLASLAVTGAPPFATFVGEFLILSGILKVYGVSYAVIVLSFLLLAFISLNYKVAQMSFSKKEGFNQASCEFIGATIPIINIVLSFCVLFAIPLISNVLKGFVL